MQEGQNIKGVDSPVIILPIHQAYRCKSGNCEETGKGGEGDFGFSGDKASPKLHSPPFTG